MEQEFDFSQYVLEDLEDIGDIRYLLADDMPGLQLPGWPGWRTRPGRSGYDPIDQWTELSQMQVYMVKYLFQGELYQNSLFYILGYWVYGLIMIQQVIGGVLSPIVSLYYGIWQFHRWHGPSGAIAFSMFLGIFVLLYWVDVNYINAEFENEE